MVIPQRMTAIVDGDFVAFLIGMRINTVWKIGKWLPVARGMQTMLRELEAAPPSTGFLGWTGMGYLTMMQYWRSFEHLEAYARDPDRSHWPSWVAFNRAMRNSRGDVGIWHETYLVKPGGYEAIYSGMPPTGLGKIGTLVPATARNERARDRLRESSGSAEPN